MTGSASASRATGTCRRMPEESIAVAVAATKMAANDARILRETGSEKRRVNIFYFLAGHFLHAGAPPPALTRSHGCARAYLEQNVTAFTHRAPPSALTRSHG